MSGRRGLSEGWKERERVMVKLGELVVVVVERVNG